MKRLSCLLVLLLALPFVLSAQNFIEIGTGNTNNNLPAYTSWNYSWSSTIYSSTDLGSQKTIDKVAFFATISEITATLNNQKVYLKHTAEDEFPSTNGYMFPYENPEANGYTLVYEGDLNYAAGWVEIDITDFDYNGTDNLILHWENEHGTENYSTQFACTDVEDSIVKCWGADNAVPQTDGYSPYPNAFPNARFIYVSDGPATPVLVAPEQNEEFVSINTTLDFELDATIDTYDLYFGESEDNLTLVAENQTAETTNTYAPETLDAMTTYYWQVVAKIGNEETASPVRNFTTEATITTFPFTYGFETEDFPTDGWHTTGTAWQKFGGDNEASSPHTGTWCARAITSAASAESDLIMPKVFVEENQRISFWWMDADYQPERITGIDSTLFQISTDDGESWTTLEVYSTDEPMTAYEQEFISLATYANQEVLMRWRDIKPTEYSVYSRGFLLDDVVIENAPSESIFTIDTTNFNFLEVVPGATSSATFTITNTGAEATINQVNVAAPFSCDFSGTIAPEETSEVVIYFTPTTNGSFSETITFDLENDLGGETSLTATADCINYQSDIFSSFDGITDFPAGWITIVEAVNQYSDVWIQSGEYDAHSGNQFVKMYNATEDSLDADLMLILPGVEDITENQLSFWTKCTWGAVGAKVQVGHISNPADASTFTMVEEYEVNEAYQEVNLTLPQTTDHYIAFRHALASDIGHSIYLDDISWQASGVSPEPATLVYPEDNAQNQQIAYESHLLTRDLEWAIGSGNPTGYYLSIGITESANEILNNYETTETSYTITYPLEYDDTIYWKVVPFNENGIAENCDTWSFSVMSDPTFTVTQDSPYEEGFETAEIGYAPISWTVEDVNEDNSTWMAIASNENFQNAHTGNQALHMMFAFLEAHDDWAYTAPLVLEANITYTLKYWVKINAMEGSFEKYRVAWGTAPNADAMENILLTNNNTTNTEYELQELSFTPEENGTYFVGFHCTSDPIQFVLLIDDIEVSYNTVNNDENAPNATKLVGNYPNPFNPSTSISFDIANESDIEIAVYNSRGQFVKMVAQDRFKAGSHKVHWDGTNQNQQGVSSGVYFIRMNNSGKVISTKKCLLLK